MEGSFIKDVSVGDIVAIINKVVVRTSILQVARLACLLHVSAIHLMDGHLFLVALRYVV